MEREQLLALLTPLGFTFTECEYSGNVTVEHPLCEDFYLYLDKDKPVPTLLEIMDDFYHSARRDESNGHRCW